MSETELQSLVPGRECGDCNVCCVSLTIDDPELKKAQGYRCPNSTPTHGCRIYDTRPNTCSSFFCGWRRLKWIRQPLRPDLSGVLVTLQYEKGETDDRTRVGLCFTLLNNGALNAEGLAESVSAAVAANVPVYMRVPGPPGYTSSQAKISDVLQFAVATRDKAQVLKILHKVRAQGRRGDHRPIVLKREDAPGHS